MDQVINYLEGINPILAAFYATLFTWGLTALGAALVVRKTDNSYEPLKIDLGLKAWNGF